MSSKAPQDNISKNGGELIDVERARSYVPVEYVAAKSLGAGSALALGAFGTTLTTLSLALMEWRGVTVTNAFVANFFFISTFGLLITAQWELSIGNGFAYTVFSAFGLFYGGYGAILTPAFGVAEAYGGSSTPEYNNAIGFFMILWTVFVFTFLIASLATNIAYIIVFLFVDLGFLLVAASYFAKADGYAESALALQKSGGVFCFLAGLIGWYIVFHLLLQDSILDLPLGDTSRFFGKRKGRAE
ncbi:GPR1/FUN34/yaaH family-domain-containing protein [Aspergillus varians]